MSINLITSDFTGSNVPTSKNIVTENEPIFKRITPLNAAWSDIKEGTQQWRIWLMQAYQDIQLRYRRSILGPFWLTISMAITVYTMGYLYAYLFHIELQRYYPFLVTGMLSWSLISIIVIEYTDAFTLLDSLIKQIKLPYSIHIHRVITRNIIIFFHNILVLVPIILLFDIKINIYFLLLIPGLLLIYINAFTYGIILAILGARYRDISQVVKSLIQVIFFMTPIMWSPEMISEKKRFIVNFNPFYSLVEIIRKPLLGEMPTIPNMIMILIITVIGLTISAILFTRYRSRIVYWL